MARERKRQTRAAGVSDSRLVSVRSLPDPATSDTEPTAKACPSCGSPDLTVFHERKSVPVHSCRLVATRDEAIASPCGALRLALCASCGFITNTAHNPALLDYGIDYEETQGFSPLFRDFMGRLARRWVERHELYDKDILEIGCGKGEFLALLCELGGNRGVGIDPAFVEGRLESGASDRIVFIRELYGENHADLATDALVCRHTLEHIAQVGDFLALIRRTAGRRGATAVLFEVPDVMRVLRERAFWDIYYEHCSYFSAGSLARLFRRTGFRVVALERGYDDQYLVVDAYPGEDDGLRPLAIEESSAAIADEAAAFSRSVSSTIARWRDRLVAARADGKRIAVWGAGSKAVSFLTSLELQDEVACAVDINPYKRGRFLAGTGHRVVAPEDLLDQPPDLVVAMNCVYVDEIRADLVRLGAGGVEVEAL